jgi:hypothetical protein
MSTLKLKRQLRRQYPTICTISYSGSGHLKLHLFNGQYVVCGASPSCCEDTLRHVGQLIKHIIRGNLK